MKLRIIVCTSPSLAEAEALAKMLTAKTGIAHHADSYGYESCKNEIIQRHFAFKIVEVGKDQHQ